MMFRFLSPYQLFSARMVVSGIDYVPISSSTYFIPVILGLLLIDFKIIYFASTCKALDVDILVSSTSAGVSLRPC